MAIPYGKKEEVRKYLKSNSCSSVQFSNKKGLQYLKVEWNFGRGQPDYLPIKNLVRKYVLSNFTGSYITSGGCDRLVFRIFDDGSTITTNQAENAVKNVTLQKELAEVLLKADCTTRLASWSQYEWMAKHAIDFLKKNGYLK